MEVQIHNNNLDEAELQNQKHNIQSNVFKITSFLNFKLQIIRLAQGH